MTPALLAERATLGTLLAEPRQLDTVAGWLRPSDFALWWHTEVYRALLANPRLARRNDPGATAEHVRSALVDALGHTRSDPPGLHTLMRTAPTRPVAARYAAMVLEASIRRQISDLAVHLQAAAVPDPALPSSDVQAPVPGPLRDVTGVVDPVLADLGAQWAAAITALSAPTAPERTTGPTGTVARNAIGGVVDFDADARRTDRQRELAVVADRAVRSAPARAPAEARADAALLVAALVTHPDRINPVARWLRPGDLGRPACAVFEALLALQEQRVPIDPVTVCWETQRAIRARGAGPEVGELMRQVDAGELVDLDSLIRTVAHDTLQRIADRAAHGLRAAAANPGRTVGDVLDAAAWATEAVTRATHDLRAAARSSLVPDASARRDPPRAGASARRAAHAQGTCRNRWRSARHPGPVDVPDLTVIR